MNNSVKSPSLAKTESQKSKEDASRGQEKKQSVLLNEFQGREQFKRKSTVMDSRASLLNSNPAAKKAVQLLQMYVSDNKKFASDILEKKVMRITELEQELDELSEYLKDFFLEIKEIIHLDEDYDKELKAILFTPELLASIQQNKPKVTLELIKHFLRGALDLRSKLAVINKMEPNAGEHPEDRDYMILYQHVLFDLKKTLRAEEQMRYIVEVTKKRLEELEAHNKNLIEKTSNAIKDFKEDYTKLIDIVKDKETDIKELAKQLSKKEDYIQALDDKLMAIFVYEHKIKTLEVKNQKDKNKLITEYEEKIKELSDLKKNDPNAFHERMVTQEKILGLERSLNNLELTKVHLEKRMNKTVQNLSNIVQNKEERLRKMNEENVWLTAEVKEKNKTLNYMQKNTEILKKKFDLAEKIIHRPEKKPRNLKTEISVRIHSPRVQSASPMNSTSFSLKDRRMFKNDPILSKF